MAQKVKVGQLWGDEYLQVRITRVSNRCAYCQQNGIEIEFGPLTEDGFPDCWFRWKLISEEPEQVVVVEREPKNPSNALYAFFAKTRPGECSCKMPKAQCRYHCDD